MTQAVIDEILRREGSKYTNYPEDRGGPTKYGITLATLRTVRGADMTAGDVQGLTEAEARDIYERIYLKPFSAYEPYPDLYALIVDGAVNHGVGRMKEWLKEINRLHGDYDSVYRELVRTRVRFYGALITKNPSQAKFAAGWANRIAEFIR